MTLEEMRKIAVARTKGEWYWSRNTYGEYLKSRNGEDILLGIDAETGLYKRAHEDDEAFISMCANNFDVMLKVIESLKEERKAHQDCYCDVNMGCIPCHPCELRIEVTDKALDELEKE